MNRILIQGGMLCTMADGATEPFLGDILIEDGRIRQIGTELPVGDAELIDATGLYVLPGLFEAHAHIGLFDFSQETTFSDANESSDPVHAALDARYGVNPRAREFRAAYQYGITDMLLTPGSSNVYCGLAFVAKSYGDNIFDMTVKAPAAVKIALGGNPKKNFGAYGRLPVTRMGVAQLLWDTFRRAQEYLAQQEAGQQPAYDADLEALLPALRGEIPCKIHCTQHDILTALEFANHFGLRFSLEHAWGAEEYLDEIIASGGAICFGPIATYRAPGERRRVDVTAVKALDAAGVNVAMVTDSPFYSEESLYHHIGEVVRDGVPHMRALRMVTINPVRQLGLEQRLGSLEAGKDADLILVQGRLGLDTDARVLLTMIDGRVVYQR